MDDGDRCPQCGQFPHPLEDAEVDRTALDVCALGEHRAERREWVYLSQVEELLYGAPSESTGDDDLDEIVRELDSISHEKERPERERPERERVRHLLRILGWEHLPLRSLVDERGAPRELWVRTQTVREIDVHIGKYHMRDHPFWEVLSEYVGYQTAHQRRTGSDSEIRKEQRKAVRRHLKEAKRPLWRGEIAEALEMGDNDVTLALAALRGDGRVVAFRYSRGRDFTYVHPDYAEQFRHVPVKELLPVDDEQEIDIYEEAARLVTGHTAIEERTLDAAFPNVRTSVLRRVMDQMGWRSRGIKRRAWWVSPEHPQYQSRMSVTRGREEKVAARRAEYQDASQDGLEEPEVVEIGEDPLGPVEARILDFLQEGGLAGAPDVAKETGLSTRHARRVLQELVEAGRVLSFPMGSAEGYIAR